MTFKGEACGCSQVFWSSPKRLEYTIKTPTGNILSQFAPTSVSLYYLCIR